MAASAAGATVIALVRTKMANREFEHLNFDCRESEFMYAFTLHV
jgi:hypothetical protein